MAKLSDSAFNRYSQFGEDGIIQKIFQILGTRSKVCIEFGAWDGFYLSNTAALWSSGWKGILIEADKKRYRSLVENTRAYPCTCIQAKVGFSENDSLERILAGAGLGLEADFLSIDIDGGDYYIFESLEQLRPRLICCEYNPTIPAQLNLIPPRGNSLGCSALALTRLAESKGYRLVSLTDTNCFFVGAEEFGKFADFETDLPALARTDHLTYLYTGQDGTFLLSRPPVFGLRKPARSGYRGDYFYFSLPGRASFFWKALKMGLPGWARRLAQRIKKLA